MRRATYALLLAGAVGLAGCSGSVDLTNASIEQVASASHRIAKPESGQWATDVTMTAFDPGGDASPMATAMKDEVGTTTRTEACLSPDDADKPLFGDLPVKAGANCRFAKFALKDGRLDAQMACRNATGERLEVRQQGQYSASAVDLTATIRRTGADGKPAGGMTTRTVAKRTGECPPA